MAADVAMVAAVAVAAVAHNPPVVTVVAMVEAKVVVDAVVNTTLLVHKAHVVPSKVMAVEAAAVKAVVVHLSVTHSPVAMKADTAAAWASGHPVARQAVNLTPCAPVSI